MAILSQCIDISNHHVVHVKYIAILFVNYTSIKLRKKFHMKITVGKTHQEGLFERKVDKF